jgi:asparagine synthase (glutamine-hydrolysing)
VYISEVAHAVNVQSSRIEPDLAEVPYEHRRMIYYLDTPPDSTLMSSWHTLRRVARSDVKVTLDGQGADEQLTGYHRYAINAVADARNPFRAAWQARRLPCLGRFTCLGVVAGILNRAGVPQLLPAMLHALGKQVYEGNTLNEALTYDAQHGLLNLLHYADRTSMAFSVEARMPFLDYRLAEFLAALPGSYKFSQGWTKFVARSAFDGKLPRSVAWRRDKMGWPAPEDYWFTGPLREWATSQIASSDFVGSLGFRSFKASRADSSLVRLARLLNLATWYRIHMEEQWQPSGLPRLEERGVVSARTGSVALSLARG